MILNQSEIQIATNKMFTKSFDYTIRWKAESYYNRMNGKLTASENISAAMTVTCLTTAYDIVVWNSRDYIV